MSTPYLTAPHIHLLTGPRGWFKVTIAMRRREKSHRGPVTIYRDNPPGPRSGVSIARVVHGHLYERDVGPEGALSPTEAAIYLKITREFLYRLIWAGKLRTIKKGGRQSIPLKALKEYEGSPGRRRRRPQS